MHTRYCAGSVYYRMCSTDVYQLKQTAAVVPQRKPSPIISSVSGIGQKKTVDAAKICGGAENVVKTETSNIRKWIALVCHFQYLYRLEARVYCSQ